MQASALPSFQADLLIQALCRTLLHSLWQGVILAAMAGIIMLGTRQRKAASRYYLLVGALALFTLGAAVTLVWEWLVLQPAPAQDALAAVEQLRITNNVTTVPPANVMTQQIFQYLNAHAQQVVLIWFLFICIKSIRMLTGLYEVRMLRSQQTTTPDARWTARVQDLARQLRISRPVSLLESSLAKAPMVLGHLKPLILVPAGLLANLAPEAIEAILLHELAHIRRRDYLVNLLQSFVEILFFFNPAVSWICALLKAERENCCDDLVMQYTQSKTVYIQALVSCQEYGHPELAMALPGSRNTLLARVTRMISNHNHSLNVMEKTLLSVCLVGAGLLLLAFPGKAAKRAVQTITTTTTTTATTQIEQQFTATDTSKYIVTPDDRYDTSTLPKLGAMDNSMASLPAFVSLDGALRPKPASLPALTGSLGKLSSACPALYWTPDNQQLEQAAQDEAEATRKLDELIYNTTEKQRIYDERAGRILDEKYREDEKAYKIAARQRVADARAYKIHAQQYIIDARDHYGNSTDTAYPRTAPSAIGAPHVQYVPNVAVQAHPAPAAAPAPMAKPAKVALRAAVAPVAPAAPAPPPAPKEPTAPVEPVAPTTPAAKDDAISGRIVKELIASRFVKNSDNLSFKISREEFIVNNKRMPADVAKAFADKYVPADHWALLYNFETNE